MQLPEQEKHPVEQILTTLPDETRLPLMAMKPANDGGAR